MENSRSWADKWGMSGVLGLRDGDWCWEPTAMRPEGTHQKDQTPGCQEGLFPGWGLTLELEETRSGPTVHLPPGAREGREDALRTY